MKIRSILLYSHDGQVRHLHFNLEGLNIITGRSSTGKSALSDIVEYCMGRSSFFVPEGTIRDKVAWYGVIFHFGNDEVLIAKPAPSGGNSRCSVAMVRRGTQLQIPDFADLSINSDDDSVVTLLSSLLGIPENKTEVPLENSRASYSATVKHTAYYLFQKQEIVANKHQLFYRQNEQHIPMAIRDTLPILLGVAPDDRFDLESKLRTAKRDLKLLDKVISEATQFAEQLDTRGIGLISEARQVGIVSFDLSPASPEDILGLLTKASAWKPNSIPDGDPTIITKLEDEQAELRSERRMHSDRLEAAKLFSEKGEGFTLEAGEQKDRLESINALPRNSSTGAWQWPFSEDNLGMDTPIAAALLNEIQGLDAEMKKVLGERPQLNSYLAEVTGTIQGLSEKIAAKGEELSSAISANQMISDLGDRNNAASRIVGRVSLFLESYRPDSDPEDNLRKRKRLVNRIAALEKEIGADDSEERLASALNSISTNISEYVRELKAEFSQYPFRFDLKRLTLVADRGGRTVSMENTGGGANHMAYHMAALLAFHQFSAANNRPIPRFLFIDQPTQVYFPSETYEKADGSIERTEADSDIESVRKLFAMLHRFTRKDCPGFQLIITEHANLGDDWFQKSLVEPPWTNPPALVPNNWPDAKR
jgi:hypothetical protein